MRACGNRIGRSVFVSAVALSSSAFAGSVPFFDLAPSPPPVQLELSPSPPIVSNLGSLSIVIVPGSGLASNTAALQAFQRAANAWGSRISDPITININADLRTTDPNNVPFAANTIGSTTPFPLTGGFDAVRNRLVADSNAQGLGVANKTTIAALPTAAQFTVTLPGGRSNSGNIFLTKANAKAIDPTGVTFGNLDTQFGTSDGTIVFNSNFTFDYDNTDGVTGGQIDFQTAATHEIGHLLGFSSAVDTIDTTTVAQAPSINPTTLDLFRFVRTGGNHPTTTAQFTTAPRNLIPGADDVTTDLLNEYRMATGKNGGDGQQASHWKDDQTPVPFIGIMDPTLSSGTIEPVTEADYFAMDLIGYDVIPEPGMVSLFAVGLVGLLMRRRRPAVAC
jgi:hypothetical protein